MSIRRSDINHGDHFLLTHNGVSLSVFALVDDQGIACLYAGDRKLVAEVFADDSIEFASGWEAFA
jgi:hypothetical protein